MSAIDNIGFIEIIYSSDEEIDRDDSPRDEGIIDRINNAISEAWIKIKNFPTPHLLSWLQIRSAWNSVKGAGSGFKLAIWDTITRVVSNALSALTAFFGKSALINAVIQTPKLLSCFGIGSGLYTLYYNVSDFWYAENRWERLYTSLDFFETLGGIADSSSTFLLGLGELGAITATVSAIVPPLATISIALSMTALAAKGVTWAQLSDWRDVAENAYKKPEEHLTIKERLEFFLKQDNALLKRHFRVEGQTIKDKILEIMKKQSDKEAETLLQTLQHRISTRLYSNRLCLLITLVSAIGLGILVFTPLTIVAHLTIVITAILGIQYLINEWYHAQVFEQAITPVES